MAANRRSFIVRVWQTEDGQLRGQISDPEDGSRRPFQDADSLWQMLEDGTLPLRASDDGSTPTDFHSEQEEQP